MDADVPEDHITRIALHPSSSSSIAEDEQNFAWNASKSFSLVQIQPQTTPWNTCESKSCTLTTVYGHRHCWKTSYDGVKRNLGERMVTERFKTAELLLERLDLVKLDVGRWGRMCHLNEAMLLCARHVLWGDGMPAELLLRYLFIARCMLADSVMRGVGDHVEEYYNRGLSPHIEACLELDDGPNAWTFGPLGLGIAGPLLLRLGYALDDGCRFDKAIVLLIEAVSLFEDELGPQHDLTWDAKGQLASTMNHAGEFDGAIELQKEIVHFRQELHQNNPDDPQLKFKCIVAAALLSSSLSTYPNSKREAFKYGFHIRDLMEEMQSVTTLWGLAGPAAQALPRAKLDLAASYYELGYRSEALNLREEVPYRELLAVLERIEPRVGTGDDPLENPLDYEQQMQLQLEIARLKHRKGVEDAEEKLKEIISGLSTKSIPQDDAVLIDARLLLAKCHFDSQKLKEAATECEAIMKVLEDEPVSHKTVPRVKIIFAGFNASLAGEPGQKPPADDAPIYNGMSKDALRRRAINSRIDLLYAIAKVTLEKIELGDGLGAEVCFVLSKNLANEGRYEDQSTETKVHQERLQVIQSHAKRVSTTAT
ncbi:hypothetical protein PT974_07223 [Cladobotryum mycophilum]|uniref:Uncharacterized protein n=1 Tax=Cladobotryum mycophilum TaxID=491253 RepID=A0ABR0SPZ8_9HYPO